MALETRQSELIEAMRFPLIVLVLFSGNNAAPKAEGVPYDQGSR